VGAAQVLGEYHGEMKSSRNHLGAEIIDGWRDNEHIEFLIFYDLKAYLRRLRSGWGT